MQTPILVSEEVLCEFYGKKVLRRTFRLPDGTEIDFYVFAGTTPVIIFALTPDNKVIAVKQFRYGANEVVLELPGGSIKPGETPEDAARNELLEETGYIPDEIACLGESVWLDPASFTVAFFLFVARACRKAREPQPEKTEIMETPVLIPLEEWIEMARRGEICDSKTLAVTLSALMHLGRL